MIRMLASAALSSLAIAAGQGCGFQEDPGHGSDFEVDSADADENHLDEGLAKETRTIADDQGNSVTLLITSKGRAGVDRFLDHTDISIEALSDFRPLYSDDDAPVPADVGEEERPDVAGEGRTSDEGLVLKVVSKSFGPDTKAFTLKFRGKETISRGDRIIPYALGKIAEYESDTYVEGFNISYASINCSNCNTEMAVEHWSRSCRLCSYRLHARRSLFPGGGWDSCNDARRTKAKILGHEQLSVYNFDFTFWNCS